MDKQTARYSFVVQIKLYQCTLIYTYHRYEVAQL